MKENDKSKEALEALRHSTSHVMAQAVQELFPGTKIAIGPVIEDGFYYDFDSEHRFTEEDFPAIEKRMRQIAEGNHALVRKDIGREQSKEFWRSKNETYKLELLEELPEAVSHYEQDGFQDLCRGPHVENTRAIRHFKLLTVAGAYWRGSEKNKMLQRIYGTAWNTKEELTAHLKMLEEAKKRDHRKLGPELDLFSIQDEAGPGLIFWHPKGALLRRIIEDWEVGELLKRGYQLAATPHVMRLDLWKTSGHSEFFSANMFQPMEVEEAKYQLKPMNCPGHILIYKSRLRSYRELPLRMAEMGTVYRYERSGVLHGLLRVRGFTQDDAHIFCTPEQIDDEVAGCVQFSMDLLKTFGFTEFKIELSTCDQSHPEASAGSPEQWDQAQGALEGTLRRMGLEYKIMPGEAAFYGPKVDIKLVDALGRAWQLSTIQFDFNLPKRFGIEYVAKDGARRQPLMVHRTLLGSMERFFGILIEQYSGRFPLWLAPVQVKVLTLTEKQDGSAQEFAKKLREAGLRPELDLRNEKIGHKVRDATLERVPYQVVIGPRDVEAGTLSVRLASGKQLQGLDPAQFVARLGEEVAQKRTASILV
ncbi:MAG: threonine--tRNA ligase [Elusimicrobiota bacterium]